MVTIIAQAPDGQWVDVPEGTTLAGAGRAPMAVKRFRRSGEDLDVEAADGRVWRFTEVAFTDARRGEVHGNTVTERPCVTWSRSYA